MLNYTMDGEKRIRFNVNKDIYPLNAIYRAAYVFIDQYYIGIDMRGDSYLIYLSSKNKENVKPEEISGEFQNELLQQLVRMTIESETKQVRELIIARGLYSAFIPEEEMASSDETDSEFSYDLDEIAKAWKNEDNSIT